VNATAAIGFGIFVLLFVVLLVALIRFTRKIKPQRDRTSANGTGPRPPAATRLADDPDHGRAGQRDPEQGRPDAEDQRERNKGSGKAQHEGPDAR